MSVIKPTLIVIKRNPHGQEVIRYTGVVLQQGPDAIILEADFAHADVPVMGALLRRGDRFIETYYTDRWYNIFEIHDREDDRLKGWYCNVGKPAVLEAGNAISYVDLALDLWVAPDGSQTVLDVDEFDTLELDAETRSKALAALAELQVLFLNQQEPGFS